MTEAEPLRQTDPLGVGLAFDAYCRWRAIKSIPNIGEKRQKEYEELKAGLSPEDRSRLADKIMDLERPDLTPPAEPRSSQTISRDEVADLFKDTLKDLESWDEKE